MRDPLFENKLIASYLVSVLIILALPLFIDRVLFGDQTRQAPKETSKASIETDVKIFEDYYAEADPRRGAKRITLCTSCHTIEPGAPPSIGPNLWGVVGRPIASKADYQYSVTLKSLEGEWTPEKLDRFLKNAQIFAPGSMMVMQVPNPSERAEIIKYLEVLPEGAPE